MKKIFLASVLFLFLTSISYSQDQLFLKGDVQIDGTILQIGKFGLQVEDAKTGKKKWYKGKKILRAIDNRNGEKIEYKFRDINGMSKYLSAEIISGEMSYYMVHFYMTNNVGDGTPGSTYGVGNFNAEYFFYRKGDKKAFYNVTPGVMSPFHKRVANYFSDCPSLSEKIKNKELTL